MSAVLHSLLSVAVQPARGVLVQELWVDESAPVQLAAGVRPSCQRSPDLRPRDDDAFERVVVVNPARFELGLRRRSDARIFAISTPAQLVEPGVEIEEPAILDA